MKKLFIYSMFFLLTVVCSCSQETANTETTTAADKAQSIEQATIVQNEANTDITPPPQPAVPVTGNPNHEAMLASDDPQLATNKRLAYDMWRTLVDGRDIEASRKYIDENYIQHNPVADTGFAGLVKYFTSLGPPQEIPERIQRPLVAILAERDLVAMAWVDLHEPSDARPYTTTIFNMYRFKGGKIVEHWDHGTLPEGMEPHNYVPPVINPDYENALVSSDVQLAANKRLVYDMWRTVLDAQQVDEAPKYLAQGYIQHNPLANTGLDGFMTFFRAIAQPKPVQPTVANFINIVAEGDKVIMATLVKYLDSNGQPYVTTWFDMWRVKDGLLVEHWDTGSFELPQRAQAD